MKGTVDIKVKNRHISFSLKLGRNVTVITGDSGTGKTKLINMIRDYSELGKSSGVSLVCDRKCIVLEGNNWEKVLDSTSGSVVFVEESTKFINSYDFADAIQKTDNYYVLVTREPLPQLPYSVDCIMNIEKHGKNPKIVPQYKNLSVKDISKFPYDVIVMEDSNSGFQLFELASEGFGLQCVSAYGKTKI
ncbi:MAG: hypothetical protein HUJ76_13165, partial [Parasporobacterium sp.]|nr:hypothetical protein [Parasporobacterium sp.]